MENIWINKFEKSIEKYSLPKDTEKIKRLIDFYNCLIEKNKVMNLTAIIEFEEALDKHFMDSLSIFLIKELLQSEGIDLFESYKLIDIGAGAGIPGIPIKIYFPKLKVFLLDSLRKRIDFINETILKLGLDETNGIHARAEDLARNNNHREKYDIAIARAVTSLPVLLEYALPFLRKNGLFVAYKGPEVSREIEASKNALELLGGELFHVKHYELPNIGDKRTLVVVKKTGETPTKYPRRSGVPEKKPL